MEEVERFDCQQTGCRRAGWWLERDARGELYVCFRVAHDGAKHVQRIAVSELDAAISLVHAPALNAKQVHAATGLH